MQLIEKQGDKNQKIKNIIRLTFEYASVKLELHTVTIKINFESAQAK